MKAPVQIGKKGKAHSAVALRVAPFLADIMGFTNRLFYDVGIYTSDRVFDMDPVSSIYSYNDVIKLRIVVYTLVLLLGVLPVEGKYGAYVAKRYKKMQYHTVKKIFRTYIFRFVMIKRKQLNFARKKLLSLYIFKN